MRRIEEKTFYLTKAELEKLKSNDIEAKLDTLIGTTWEQAMRFKNYNGGFQMKNILDAKKRTIGFMVTTIDDPHAKFPDVSDEVVKLLNNPLSWKYSEEELRVDRESYRSLYRSILLRAKY